MKYLVSVFLLLTLVAEAAPIPFPVFLKMGFSSILEFDQAPTRVVLGDGQSFQVERLNHSLVIRALAPYATSDMFVYFGSDTPRLFMLTASEDANPTFYKKFEPEPSLPTFREAPQVRRRPSGRGTQLLTAQFDPEKDFLTLDLVIAANSKEPLNPIWDWIRLLYNHSAIKPDKLWAERREIQRDSAVRVRLIFTKPNIPRSLDGVSLVIPIQGHLTPIHLTLSTRSR